MSEPVAPVHPIEGLPPGSGGEESAPRAFDERLAGHRVVVLPADEVIDLLHVTHASDRIAEYAQAMRAGALFPPVSTVRLFGCTLVADGHKRLSAARACGLRELPVEVWPWRRWLLDQGGQAARQARKHLDIVLLLPRRPRDAAALAGSTLQHWWRVARSLAARVSMPRR